MKHDKEILRTYSDIWHMPFKIYSIDRIKLPVAVNPWDAVYYGVGVLFSSALDFIYPGDIGLAWKYALIPLFVRFILAKTKLDGKRPHRFFIGMFIYFLNRGKKEFFKPAKRQVLRNFKGEENI